MSRYIEIDTALLKTVTAGRLSAKALWKRIMQQPSIDIVRCRECRFSVNVITSWSANGENKRVERLCKVNSHNVNDDDFCSYGERSEP